MPKDTANRTFRWNAIQQQAEQPLHDLLKSIRNDFAGKREQYPEGHFEQRQFVITKQETADDWIRSAFDIYVSAIRDLGHEPSLHAATIWENGLSSFIDGKIKDLLEEVFLSAKEREFLRLAPSMIARLNRPVPRVSLDFVVKSEAGLKMEMV